MKTTVLLIRHGETEWNKMGKFQGGTDIPLADDGIRQAKLLRDRINGEFDYIYTSPLSRALETARIVASKSKSRVIIAPEIREINFGEWEGLTIKGIAEKYPEVFEDWKTSKIEGSFIGGDLSIHNASSRSTKCIMDIVNKHKGKRIVIIAHGGIIKAGLIGIFGWDMTMYHKMALGNTCINTVIFNDDLKPVLVCLNDTNHLDIEAKTV